jgi:hypothetical protein
MIPAITPPTDNLHKFLSLFGLTIFLFAIYNLGFVFDRSAASKMKIEDIKIEVQKKLYRSSEEVDPTLRINPVKKRFRLAKIRQLGEDLEKIQEAINKTGLRMVEKIELNGRISKLKVEVDALFIKLWTCIGITVLGLVVMIFGFFRWHYREQKLRDLMLEFDYKMKENLDKERSQKRGVRETVPVNP